MCAHGGFGGTGRSSAPKERTAGMRRWRIHTRQSGGPRRRRFGAEGFTMLELMTAMSILAVVALGFATSTALGLRTVLLARQRQTASELATARLEHLRSVPYSQVALS